MSYERPAMVERCLASIVAQSRPVDAIVVVDNGSRDDTEARLKALAAAEPRLRVLRRTDNGGPAAGFSDGLAAALETGCTHAWACDDDAFPHPQCLERQLAHADVEGEEIVFPSILDGTGRTTRYPGWSAVLIAAAAVRRGGLPRADLFWWIEDTEYLQWRLPRHGARTGFCAGAVVEHAATRPRRKPAWRFYYEVRNTLWYRLHVQRGRRRRRAARIAAVVGKAVARTLVREDHKLRKLVLIARGVADGVRGALGKRVDPATETRAGR